MINKESFAYTIPWHKHNIKCANKRLKKELRLPERQQNSQLIRRLQNEIATSIEIVNWFSNNA